VCPGLPVERLGAEVKLTQSRFKHLKRVKFGVFAQERLAKRLDQALRSAAGLSVPVDQIGRRIDVVPGVQRFQELVEPLARFSMACGEIRANVTRIDISRGGAIPLSGRRLAAPLPRQPCRRDVEKPIKVDGHGAVEDAAYEQ